jgi:hypothetical protein
MANVTEKKKPLDIGGWVIHSVKDGQIIAKIQTKKDAQARARFLSVASLSAVPKKSTLTQSQAEKAVRKFIETRTEISASKI